MVMLRNVDQCSKFLARGLLACSFPAAAQVLFATRMVPDFKIDGRVCKAFRPCSARATTRGAKSEHSTSLTPALYTADDKKLCGAWKQGWGMSKWSHQGLLWYSRYMWSRTVSVVDISVPDSTSPSIHSQTRHTYTCNMWCMVWIRIPGLLWVQVLPSGTVNRTIVYYFHRQAEWKLSARYDTRSPPLREEGNTAGWWGTVVAPPQQKPAV